MGIIIIHHHHHIHFRALFSSTEGWGFWQVFLEGVLSTQNDSEGQQNPYLASFCHSQALHPMISLACQIFSVQPHSGISISIGIYWMQCIEFGLSIFSDIVCWHSCLSVEPNRFVNLLMVLKKTDKNIVASWNFWLVYMNIIYRCVLSWYDMSTKEHMYKLVKRRLMGLHSDLHNVIPSLAKFVSGSSNE